MLLESKQAEVVREAVSGLPAIAWPTPLQVAAAPAKGLLASHPCTVLLLDVPAPLAVPSSWSLGGQV